MIHKVKLKKTITYTCTLDETFEGHRTPMTAEYAIDCAKEYADGNVFLSWDDTDEDFETVSETPWECVEHTTEEGADGDREG